MIREKLSAVLAASSHHVTALVVTGVLVTGGGTTLGLALTGGSPSVSVSSVASSLGAVSAISCGPAPLGGVSDSGTAMLGPVRIGIDVFPSSVQRDAWKTSAASLGISPMAQGSQWVAYKALNQHATGCQ